MKLKTDFTTNSSSSSFVVLEIQNPIVAKIIDMFKDELIERFYAYIEEIDNDTRVINIEEAWVEMPSTKEEIIFALMEILAGKSMYFDANDMEEEVDEILKEIKDNEIAMEIFTKRKEIMEAMESLTISNTDLGWQGDSDARYYEDNYDELLFERNLRNNCRRIRNKY